MILKEISVYREKFNNHLPKETKIVLHYQNIEAVEDKDKIIINTGKDSLAFKVFDLDGTPTDPLKMKLTSYEGETKVVKVNVDKIKFNTDGDLAVNLEFKALNSLGGGAGDPGIYSLH
ncbi:MULTISPECIES: hypothetical protein [Bacillus amyloliquefaciens group]|uniref:hypothetical protein n=1 Tax=Bacillus amyloliquefaciens group TaxID=1938374 RepID=UPI002270627B|nr:hypothetical protein [Bacillus velezensis]MCY0089296.1 hypothetical protein [Bacillus velezensis]